MRVCLRRHDSFGKCWEEISPGCKMSACENGARCSNSAKRRSGLESAVAVAELRCVNMARRGFAVGVVHES